MLSYIAEMISFDFIQRAFAGGLLVSLCAALLGVVLVLKRYSMIGDGLSHVGFGALAVGTALGATPMYVAIPVVIIAAFLLLRLKNGSKIKGDAATAIISTSALALGVVVISFSSGANTDVYNYMFGSILALTREDIVLITVLSVVVILVYLLTYNKIFAVTFDEKFAASSGINVNLYNMVIAFLSALIIVVGMKMMGALLISALIIFPSLSAMRICKRFRSVTICAAVISVVCFTAGLTVSVLFDAPSGASIVLSNLAAFIILSVAGRVRN